MQPFRQRLQSSQNMDMSNVCCSASSMDTHQRKVVTSLCDDSSNHSESTAVTEALSMGSSFHSDLLESPHATSVHSFSTSASKNKDASSCLSKGRRIRFSHDVVQWSIIGRHEFTESELNACWFRGEEYAAITRSCLKEIQKLEQGAKLRDGRCCARGLESHTRLAGLAKAETRRAGWDAVLLEQDEQIGFGVIDEEAIAMRYQDVSSSCQLWAVKRALDDQGAAELAYDDDSLDEN